VNNTSQIIAAEILMASQAVSMTEDVIPDHPPAKATAKIIKQIRKTIPARLDGDVWYADDMAAIVGMVRAGEVLRVLD